jgi:hypothetical protein
MLKILLINDTNSYGNIYCRFLNVCGDNVNKPTVPFVQKYVCKILYSSVDNKWLLMVPVLNILYILFYLILFYGFMHDEPSLHPWSEINLFMVYDLFHVLLNSACQTLVKIFCLYSLKILVYNILYWLHLYWTLNEYNTGFSE